MVAYTVKREEGLKWTLGAHRITGEPTEKKTSQVFFPREGKMVTKCPAQIKGFKLTGYRSNIRLK